MPDTEDTIAVLTARSLERIVREGGSQSWVLNPVRSKQCTWLLCTQNQHHQDHEFSAGATAPHGTGFLLGRISEIRKSSEGEKGRWMIAISEYAQIAIPDAWDHRRNPVRYTTLAQFGINPDELEFQPMPERDDPVPAVTRPAPPLTPVIPGGVLTIAEAKKQLAAAFGIKPDAIEITIRG